MLSIEFVLMIAFVILILRSGYQSLLTPYKEAIYELQKEKISYDGKNLWKD